jgi:DNA (cytosine-5)-methyltransferase 1
MALRTLDMFCGGGGSSWGAKAAGAEIVCGVDAWEIAQDTYADNFPMAQAVCAELNGKSTRKVVGDIGDIDLILSSPECTNHTCAKGNAKRDEGSKETARFILNYAKTFRPRWIVLENVVNMRGWKGYGPLIKGLEKEYFVRPQVLDASTFGVPQARRRLFLICDRERMPDKVIPRKGIRRKTAGDILDPQGTWNAGFLRTEKRAPATIERAERAIAELGTGVPFLIVYYGSDGSGGWQPLDRPLRTLTTLDRFGLVEWDGRKPTLRMLQVPELHRAMGFTKGFKLRHGSRRDRIRILGNGVCPPVMKAIVRSLKAGTGTTS